MSEFRRRLMMAGGGGDDHQQEYVTMASGCYIELPFIADNDTRVVCEVMPLSKNGTQAYFFGSGIPSTSPSRFALRYYNTSSTNIRPYYYVGTVANRRDQMSLAFNINAPIDMTSLYLKIKEYSVNYNGGEFTALKNFIINGCYTSDTSISSTLDAKWKLMQIYSGSTLMYNLVAWKDDNDVYGLYDKLTNVLYTSSSNVPITQG